MSMTNLFALSLGYIFIACAIIFCCVYVIAEIFDYIYMRMNHTRAYMEFLFSKRRGDFEKKYPPDGPCAASPNSDQKQQN